MDTDISPLMVSHTESYLEFQSKSKENKKLNNGPLDPSIEKSKYNTIPYFSNYYPISDTRNQYKKNNDSNYSYLNFSYDFSLLNKNDKPFFDKYYSIDSKKRTEYLLKKYYETKRNTFERSIGSSDNYINPCQNNTDALVEDIPSISNKNNNNTYNDSSSYITIKQQGHNTQRERNISLLHVDEFLKNYPEEIDNCSMDGRFDPKFDGSMVSKAPRQLDNKAFYNIKSTSSYFRYMEQLRTVVNINDHQINKHRQWVPMKNKNLEASPMKSNDVLSGSTLSSPFKSTLTNHFDDISNNENTTCTHSSTLTGENYVINLYGPNSGIMSSPSTYSENKLPSFIYHCSVAVDDEVFIFGGLVPSYRYDEEAPDLNDFEVDGIKYLPPPLLDEVLNNPCMVTNPFVYIITTSTNHIKRAPLLGQIPPNLLCATASMLNDRYIFLFGGMTVKTSANFDPVTEKYYMKKRAFGNNVGYIFDTKTFYFTKIEILLGEGSNNLGTVRNFPPRFGHAQVSINPCDICNSLNNSNLGSSFKSSIGNDISKSSPASNGQLNTILIFGGYKRVGHEKYIATNDLWRIDVSITMHNKSGYIKFGTSATACLIIGDNNKGSMELPPKRAFMGYSFINRIPYSNSAVGEESTSVNLENVLQTLGIKKKNDEVASQDSTKEDYNLSEESDSIFGEKNSRRKNENITLQASVDQNANYIPTDNIYLKLNNTKCPLNSHFHKYLENSKTCKALLIHGGSNETNVFGDLWWFNFNSCRWENIDLYGRTRCTSDKDTILVPINLKLVGHSLNINGGILSLKGGLNENDINILYGKKCVASVSESNLDVEIIKLDDLSNKCFDLTTQCLFDREIIRYCNGDSDSIIVNVTSNSDRYMPTFFGTSSIYANGKLVIIGGVYCRRKNIKYLYLRGTLLYAIPVRYSAL